MSIVAEYTIDPPVYTALLESGPAPRLEIEQVTARTPDVVGVTLRVHEGDFTMFEETLERTDTVACFEQIDEHPGFRRYQLHLPATETTYWEWAGLGGVLLDATVTAGGATVRMRFPDREALVAYRDHCRGRGMSFTLESLHDDTEAFGTTSRMTTCQHDIIVAAVEKGYFDVPRGIRMTELAETFDISDQAASERLRRGLSNLLGNGALDSANDHRPVASGDD